MFALRFILLFVTWVVLSGKFDWFHLGLGCLSSLMVARTTGNVILKDRVGRFQPAVVLRFCGYALWLLGEVIKANIQVFLLVLRADLLTAISPKIVEFDTSLNNEFARFVFANSITLTPGTVTVLVDGAHFVVHALTEEMAEGLPGEMERRIAAVFEPEASS